MLEKLHELNKSKEKKCYLELQQPITHLWRGIVLGRYDWSAHMFDFLIDPLENSATNPSFIRYQRLHKYLNPKINAMIDYEAQ